MVTKKPSLGRGLGALLGQPVTTSRSDEPPASQRPDEQLLKLPVDLLQRGKYQPRIDMRTESLQELADSIRSQGVIQPVVVRPVGPPGGAPGTERYEIIAGERRWLAARRAGLETIPAVLHDVDERETLVLALVENLVREDLSPLETARAYAALQDEFGMSVAELARSVGRSRPAVANTLRLLELPDDVLEMLEERRITEGHGRALLGCSDRVRLLRLARLTVDRSLTVRALEAAVRDEELALAEGAPVARSRRSKWNLDPAPELVEQVDRLAEQLLGVRGRVKLGERGAKLELHCDEASDLFALVERLEAALAASPTQVVRGAA